jgi:anti-sigma factor RsiW
MKGERLVGGLRCGEVLEKLDAFVDGTLEAEARPALLAHVAGCDRCARFGGTYAAVVQRLLDLGRADDPAPAVLARLHARLAALEPR